MNWFWVNVPAALVFALAARAIQLTSVKLRRDLAASVQRILAAAGGPAEVMASPAGAVTRRGCRCAGRGSASPRCRWPGWPGT
ncbi:MAG TPA: hypothetical protein VED20_11770 [Streptosporangiaceae bacterium]|nr:hypothetical protein [Streptosporangiaceae bacterium]